MYANLLGITFLKSCRPYFLKNIFDTIDIHDFLLINTIFIMMIVFVYFAINFALEKNSLSVTCNNCSNLSLPQYLILFGFALFTVFSTVKLVEFDLQYNTPAINAVLINTVALLSLFFVGRFIFNEDYEAKHIGGFTLISLGTILLISDVQYLDLTSFSLPF